MEERETGRRTRKTAEAGYLNESSLEDEGSGGARSNDLRETTEEGSGVGISPDRDLLAEIVGLNNMFDAAERVVRAAPLHR